MRVLHLYSDWKWTGPAEPAIQACRSLADMGHEVVFACPREDREYDETVGRKAAGLGLAVDHSLGLNRYFKIGPTLHDLVAIPRVLRKGGFDIVHCHLSHDHAFAGLMARMPGTGAAPVVRSLYKRSPLADKAADRFLMRRLTDGYVTFTRSFRERYIERFGLAPERVVVAPMSVDLERFAPGAAKVDMRQQLGLTQGAPVIGIVGRFQKYRRAEVFIAAARRLLQDVPDAKFLIIGRSSQIRETVVKPIQEMGIADSVVLSGYRRDDYVDTLDSVDVFTLLMPGFDGTARAVREALALGKPCVVSDYGMLPEVVEDGRTGFVVPVEAEALAQGWRRIIQDGALRCRMGQAAREDAEKRFRIDAVGPVLAGLYERILKNKKG
jgi:glycosyltransferase involved in cell wall biosynthesis